MDMNQKFQKVSSLNFTPFRESIIRPVWIPLHDQGAIGNFYKRKEKWFLNSSDLSILEESSIGGEHQKHPEKSSKHHQKVI